MQKKKVFRSLWAFWANVETRRSGILALIQTGQMNRKST